MPDESKGLADSLTSLGSALAAPAKLAFAGYVLLAATGKIESSGGEFFVVAVLFFFAQIWHDDYYRIRLNEKARLNSEIERKKRAQGQSPDGP